MRQGYISKHNYKRKSKTIVLMIKNGVKKH